MTSIKVDLSIHMTANYTDVSPIVTALLDRYHAVGVPLYLALPKSGGDGKALPTVLTIPTVRSTIEWAAR
jgi:thiol:disulfide interchange protein